MHCEITDCYFNTFFCWNTNEKRNLGKYFFSTQTGIPVSQMVWICHWNLSWKGFCLVFILISSYIILECYFSMFDFSSRKTVYCFITLAVSSNSHHQRRIYRTQSNIKLYAIYGLRFLVVYYLQTRAPNRCLTGFQICL